MCACMLRTRFEWGEQKGKGIANAARQWWYSAIQSRTRERVSKQKNNISTVTIIVIVTVTNIKLIISMRCEHHQLTADVSPSYKSQSDDVELFWIHYQLRTLRISITRSLAVPFCHHWHGPARILNPPVLWAVWAVLSQSSRRGVQYVLHGPGEARILIMIAHNNLNLDVRIGVSLPLTFDASNPRKTGIFKFKSCPRAIS